MNTDRVSGSEVSQVSDVKGRPLAEARPRFVSPTSAQNKVLGFACDWALRHEFVSAGTERPLCVDRINAGPLPEGAGFYILARVPRWNGADGCGVASYSLKVDMRTGEDLGSTASRPFDALGFPRLSTRPTGPEVSILTRLMFATAFSPHASLEMIQATDRRRPLPVVIPPDA
jgi:hypothetical protein